MSLSRGIRNRCGEDRFYCPPAMRRQQQQQQQQRLQSNTNKSPKSNPKASLTDAEKRIESDDGASATTTTAPSAASSSPVSTPRTIDLTNLDRFLEHTTPSVFVQRISKTPSRGGGGTGWRRREQKLNPYFILGDLWESFKEWSAYGAGVPLVLSGSDSAVQYYVPYLSAIQLYIDPSKPEMTLRRRPSEESDADSSRDTSSDGSNDHVQGGCSQLMRFNGLVGSLGDEDNITNPPNPGSLVFEYFEHDLPYGREPLADKIAILASQFPKLITLRSCDLTSASWVSVAWYPIYRIPVGSTLQNLDACFLTFHSLSTTPMRSMNTRELESPMLPSKLLLPTFGLASYKLKVSVWNSNGVDQENQKVGSLQKAAENWLRRLQVNHPDYTFFISHGSYIR